MLQHEFAGLFLVPCDECIQDIFMFLDRNLGILLFRLEVPHRQAVPKVGGHFDQARIFAGVPDGKVKGLIQVGIGADIARQNTIFRI